MKKIAAFLFAAGSLLAWAGLASAHGPHVHGLAHMDMSVEGREVEITLATPLANLLSFEHEPQTDAQRKEARDMAAALRKADALFVFPAEAQCRLKEISLESAAMDDEHLSPEAFGRSGGKASKAARHGHDEHGDLELEAIFTCNSPEKLNSVTVDIFRFFPDVRKVKARLATGGGQSGAELTPEANALRWR